MCNFRVSNKTLGMRCFIKDMKANSYELKKWYFLNEQLEYWDKICQEKYLYQKI